MTQTAKKKVFDERYEILSIVGRGSRSVVYHARHVKDPSTEVALKVLLEQKSKTPNPERLRKEALALVSSRHRYVIRLDDFHSVGSLCYLSLEFAPEGDLRKFASKTGGQLDAELAERFILQIAEGLAFVHKAGIIHRDVKPDNILVVSATEARLADFGVAVLPGDTASIEDLRAGIGTMNYLAPEVLEGKPADQRSDLYALAVSFYELLTGTNPFATLPLARQVEGRRDENITRLKTLAPKTPDYLATSIMQAMSFDPEARFPSVRDFIQALLVNKSTLGTTPSPEASVSSDDSRVLFDFDDDPTATTPVAPSSGLPDSEVTDTWFSVKPEPPVGQEEKTQAMPKYQAPPSAVKKPSEEVGQTVVVSPVTETVVARASDIAAITGAVEDTIQVKKPDMPPGSDPTQTTFIPQQTINELRNSPEQPKASGASISSTRAKRSPQPIPTPLPPRLNLSKLALLGAGAGLAVAILAVGVVRFFSSNRPDTAEEVAAKDFVSPIPPVSSEDYVFPRLPSGLYVGSMSGLLPGKKIPLVMISNREKNEITVVAGVEGWTPAPTAVRISDPNSTAPSTFRAMSNGYIVEFAAQTVYGELYGTFKNLVTGAKGEWRARPVGLKRQASDKKDPVANSEKPASEQKAS